VCEVWAAQTRRDECWPTMAGCWADQGSSTPPSPRNSACQGPDGWSWSCQLAGGSVDRTSSKQCTRTTTVMTCTRPNNKMPNACADYLDTPPGAHTVAPRSGWRKGMPRPSTSDQLAIDTRHRDSASTAASDCLHFDAGVQITAAEDSPACDRPAHLPNRTHQAPSSQKEASLLDAVAVHANTCLA
jgi:hypothetical protein